MQRSLLKKLRGEVRRYQSNDFLKACMAVCALSAAADHKIKAVQIRQIDHLMLDDPALRYLNDRKARQKLKEYLLALRNDREKAQRVLSGQVARMAGAYKLDRTLMRVAYVVMAADHTIRPLEKKEFERLCGLLDLEPGRIFEELATRFLVWDDIRGAALVQAPASETARIVNESLQSKWVVFEKIGEAKAAAAALYRRVITYLKDKGKPTDDFERRLAELPHLTIKQLPNVYDHAVGKPI